MKIAKATETIRGLARAPSAHLADDLDFKHEQMRTAPFPFLRATYYRWAQIWAGSLRRGRAAPQRCWPSAICTWRTSARGATSKAA